MTHVAEAHGEDRIRGTVITPCVLEELVAKELFYLSHTDPI